MEDWADIPDSDRLIVSARGDSCGERQDKLMVDASMQLQNQQEEDKLIVRREEGRRKKLELGLVNIKMAVGLIYVVSRAVLCQKELDKNILAVINEESMKTDQAILTKPMKYSFVSLVSKIERLKQNK